MMGQTGWSDGASLLILLSQFHVMKTSARNATWFIFFLFLFFNGVQVYLVTQRIAGTKAKFNEACTNALLTTLFEYNKLK